MVAGGEGFGTLAKPINSNLINRPALALGLSNFPSGGYRTSDFAFFRENRAYIDIEKPLGQKIRQAY